MYSLVYRGFLLFALGVCFFWICDALHSIRGELFFSKYSFNGLLNPKVWVPICCGIASVAIGLLSPLIDFKFGRIDVYNNEWSTVLRCAALFFGLSHATARIDFATYSQLSLTIFGLSTGLWWLFDRSCVGFGFGTAAAIIATSIRQSFAWNRLLKFSHPTMAIWLPALCFSGAVTVVLVGRQLAKPEMMAHMTQKVK